MSVPLRKDSISLEGFDELWENPEQPQSPDSITKHIRSILKVLVDERVALNEEHKLVNEFRENIHSLDIQIQKLNWQLGQREQELSNLYSEHHQMKVQKENLEKEVNNQKELIKENKEIRRLAEQLSNQILMEKAKNEQLTELLMQLKKPELKKIVKKLGI